jgi:uncharacterized protein
MDVKARRWRRIAARRDYSGLFCKLVRDVRWHDCRNADIMSVTAASIPCQTDSRQHPMNPLISDFLDQKALAVAGVSGRDMQSPSNAIFRKFKEAGYRVYPVNPNASTVEGETCYPDVKSLPESVGGVVIATAPSAAASVARDCVEAGIKIVWFHRSFGGGSYSDEAVSLCREKGIAVISSGCPLMYCEPVDPGHKCIRWILKFFGRAG